MRYYETSSSIKFPVRKLLKRTCFIFFSYLSSIHKAFVKMAPKFAISTSRRPEFSESYDKNSRNVWILIKLEL